MKLLILCCALLIVAYLDVVELKRGGGSRGGSRTKSSSHSSWWSSSNNKKSSNTHSKPVNQSPPAPAPAPKPSAPKPETKTNVHTQHSANPQHTNQQPIGWNVPGSNQHGYKGNQGRFSTKTSRARVYSVFNKMRVGRNPKRNHPKNGPKISPGIHQQSHSYPTNGQPHGGAWGSNQHGGAWGSNQQGGAWGSNQHGGAWGGNPHGGGWGNQQGSYGSGYGHQGGWGGGGGYNQHSGYSGFGGGGYGGHNSWGGGMQGSPVGFGGGYSPYGMQQKRGFFSGGGSTFGNILTGMAIYHVSSSLMKGVFGDGHSNKQPYVVHNYYNQPQEGKEEIKLQSNMLKMCEGNLTNACTGSTSICTTNNTVLCVVTMAQTVPCEQEKAMCVNTTIPCIDKSDPLCQNTTKEQTETTFNVPCYTNLSIDVNLLNEQEGTKNGEEYQYCVTTMAVAGTEYPICSEESVKEKHDYRSVLAGNLTYNLTISPMMRIYQVYNHENPMPSSAGQLVLPLEVLIPCIDNATKLCPPDVVTICTGYGEIMCIQPVAKVSYSDDYNTTIYESTIPCNEAIEDDFLCQNKTEEELIVKDDKKFVKIDIPCFNNITVNTNLPDFDINTFNGTLPQMAPSSFTYHYHFCLMEMSLPGPETSMCLISDG